MTFQKICGKLRRQNIKDYGILAVCIFISSLLITAFAVVMQSDTVQTMLPPGGDSRKQMTMIFAMAAVGCAVFTAYASALFFRCRSREIGIFTALGAPKRVLVRTVATDSAQIAALCSAAGILVGTPLAAGIWQLFRMFVNTRDMAFSFSPDGFLWPLAFAVFTLLLLLFMSSRFVKKSNPIRLMKTEHKSESVKDVHPASGIMGVILLVGGAAGAVILPHVFASMGYMPPVWIYTLYIVSGTGLYKMLLFVTVRGIGGKKSRYKNIVAASSMKFWGRQTVSGMCVMSVLLMAAYFAMFYYPMKLGPAIVEFESRSYDFAFRHRSDETEIPDRTEIEQLAEEYGTDIRNYRETEFVNLATDGFDRNPTDDGRFANDYREFYAEAGFFPESAFREISGSDISVEPGTYVYVIQEEYVPNPYDYIREMTRFTNPDTKKYLSAVFSREIKDNMLRGFIILSDSDYAEITAGLSDEWREKWVVFDTGESESNYDFAKRLKNIIIDRSTEKSAVFEIYDRIERMNAHAAGESYRGDTDIDLQVDYSERDSSKFSSYWRYYPAFRVLDHKDFVMNNSVFLILFIFIAIICTAAVAVTAYTRCLTMALVQKRMFGDLHRLGASRDYLRRVAKKQVYGMFFIPATVATVSIYGFFTLLMYANSGAIERGELIGLVISAVLVFPTSLLLCAVCRKALSQSYKVMEI